MAETVSGNEVPEESEVSEVPEDTADPVVNNYTYEIDNSEVCKFLDSILSETVKGNELLEKLIERFSELMPNSQTDTQEDELSDADPGESPESESYQETVVELLEKMDSTLATIEETGESISDTISGNSSYLEDTGNTAAGLLEAYTEVSAKQSQNEIYGLSLGIGTLFIAACIAGLLIARAVWGKMR